MKSSCQTHPSAVWYINSKNQYIYKSYTERGQTSPRHRYSNQKPKIKQIGFLVSILLLLHTLAHAQPDCNQMLRDGDALMARKNPPLEEALHQYLNALNCNSNLAGVIGPKIQHLYEAIKQQQERERAATKRAQEEARRATASETKARKAEAVAIQEKNKADSIADAALKAAHRAFADDLAYKSSIALRDGERSTAFRLAQFAHRFVDPGNPKVVQAMMDAYYYNDHPDSTRRLPWQLSSIEMPGSISAMTIAPDGKTAVVAWGENFAGILDLEQGRILKMLYGHSGSVRGIAVDKDGKRCATASNDNTVKIWDMASGGWVLSIGPVDYLGLTTENVLFSPDGQYVVTASADLKYKVWSLKTGNCVHIFTDNRKYRKNGMAFSPSGKYLATTNGEQVYVWDWQTKTLSTLLNAKDLDVDQIAYSPVSDDTIAFNNGADIQIWSIRQNKCISTLQGHKNIIRSLCFSADGALLASGSFDKTAKVWDWRKNSCVANINGHRSSISGMGFLANGQKLTTSSEDGSIKIWDIRRQPAALTLTGPKNIITTVQYSHNGKWIAGWSDDKMGRLWNATTGTCEATLDGQVHSVNSISFSPDDRYLAAPAPQYQIKLWPLQAGEAPVFLTGHKNNVNCVAFSPDGKYLASGATDGIAKLWDIHTQTCLFSFEGRARRGMQCLAWSPDGRQLATGSSDSLIRIWNVQTGQCEQILTGHKGLVCALTFSRDGARLFSGSWDTSVKIWDLNTGKNTNTLQLENWATALSLSPDGKSIATGDYAALTQVWNLATLNCDLTLNGHEINVSGVAYSPDGNRLATASYDKTIRIWDLNPDSLIARAERLGIAHLDAYQLNYYNLGGICLMPGNEAKLLQTQSPRQIAAFGDLFAEKTTRSRLLETTAPDYTSARRFYQPLLQTTDDENIRQRLGKLFLRWTQDILQSERPDTAGQYLQNASVFGAESKSWIDAALQYSSETGKLLEDLHWFQPKYASFFDPMLSYALGKADEKPDLDWQITVFRNVTGIRERQLLYDTTLALRKKTAEEYARFCKLRVLTLNGLSAWFCIQRIQALDPENPDGNRYLPFCLLLRKMPAEAREAYLRLAPLRYSEGNTYREVFLSDCAEFKAKNLAIPGLEEMATDLMR